MSSAAARDGALRVVIANDPGAAGRLSGTCREFRLVAGAWWAEHLAWRGADASYDACLGHVGAIVRALDPQVSTLVDMVVRDPSRPAGQHTAAWLGVARYGGTWRVSAACQGLDPARLGLGVPPGSHAVYGPVPGPGSELLYLRVGRSLAMGARDLPGRCRYECHLPPEGAELWRHVASLARAVLVGRARCADMTGGNGEGDSAMHAAVARGLAAATGGDLVVDPTVGR